MPPLESMDRYQTAVLWAATSRNDKKGKPTVLPPVQIDVQWDDTYRVQRDPAGNVVTVLADVMTDQDIPIGSILALGQLNAWDNLGTGSANPDGTPAQLLQVVGFSKKADLKGRDYERIAHLSKFSKYLPTVETQPG